MQLPIWSRLKRLGAVLTRRLARIVLFQTSSSIGSMGAIQTAFLSCTGMPAFDFVLSLYSVCLLCVSVPKSWCTYDNLQEVLETIWAFWFFCLSRWQKAWNVTCFWNSLPLNASLLWNVPVYPIKNPTEKGTKLNEAPLYTPWKRRLMLAHCLCACVLSYFSSIETALRSPSKLSSLLFGDCINQALVTLCLSW